MASGQHVADVRGNFVIVHHGPGTDEDGEGKQHAGGKDPGQPLVIELEVHEDVLQPLF